MSTSQTTTQNHVYPKLVEWIPEAEAVARLGRSAKTLERIVLAGEVDTKLEPRAGKKPQKLYYAPTIERIASEIAERGDRRRREATGEARPNASSSDLVISKPVDVKMALSSETLTTIEGVLERWLDRDEKLDVFQKIWLTWEEARDVSGIPYGVLRKLCVEGEILAKQFGRSWRVHRESLQAWR